MVNNSMLKTTGYALDYLFHFSQIKLQNRQLAIVVFSSYLNSMKLMLI